jgi:cytochrome oxidase assembly protein ShyY1
MLPVRMAAPPLASRRSLKVLLLAVLVAGVCVRLGVWQIARLHERNAFVAALHHGLSQPPVPITSLLPNGEPVDPASVRYRRVTVTGTYDIQGEVVLYGRGLSSQVNGNHLLTPLLMPGGTALVVDRGWVPAGNDTPPVSGAAPPTGTVTETGILIPSEGGLPGDGGGPPVTETTHVDLAQLSSQLPYRVAPLYLLLQTQTPGQAALPKPAPFLLPSAPPHLSYAIQWFSFATIALVGAVILIGKERRAAAPDGREPVGSSGR